MKYCDNCHSAYPDDFTICPRDQGSLRYASELVEFIRALPSRS